MQSTALKTHTVPTVPTQRETTLFLLSPHGAFPELTKDFDGEEDDLTFVKYYSPTSD